MASGSDPSSSAGGGGGIILTRMLLTQCKSSGRGLLCNVLTEAVSAATITFIFHHGNADLYFHFRQRTQTEMFSALTEAVRRATSTSAQT